MAALLVALAVMAVLMSVALPVWRQQAQREKEEELVFRGQQYMRALRLYQARTQTMPGSVDLLVTGRFIRKKYKDPITNDDFELIGQGGVPGQAGQQAAPSTGRGSTGQPGQSAGPGRSGQPASGRGSGISSPGGFGASSGGGFGGTVVGGIMGVRSKSKDESIRLYQGRNHYNEWMFVMAQQAPGGGGPQRGQPGGGPQRGQPGQGTGPGTGVGTPGRGGRSGSGVGSPGTFGAPGGQPFPPTGRGGAPGRGRGGSL